MADDGYKQGWHERNGGNLSYRLKKGEVDAIRGRMYRDTQWQPIGTEVPGLAGEFFLVTGTGKYFRNIIVDPEACLAIIEIDETGSNYRIRLRSRLRLCFLWRMRCLRENYGKWLRSARLYFPRGSV